VIEHCCVLVRAPLEPRFAKVERRDEDEAGEDDQGKDGRAVEKDAVEAPLEGLAKAGRGHCLSAPKQAKLSFLVPTYSRHMLQLLSNKVLSAPEYFYFSATSIRRQVAREYKGGVKAK
jgi:hypothetical protein